MAAAGSRWLCGEVDDSDIASSGSVQGAARCSDRVGHLWQAVGNADDAAAGSVRGVPAGLPVCGQHRNQLNIMLASSAEQHCLFIQFPHSTGMNVELNFGKWAKDQECMVRYARCVVQPRLVCDSRVRCQHWKPAFHRLVGPSEQCSELPSSLHSVEG